MPPIARSWRSSGQKRWPAVLATAALLTASSLLSACTSAVGQQQAAANGEPVSGGVVRIGTTSDLTPALVYAGTKPAERVLTGLVFEELVTYPTDSLEPQPELAERWDVSPDGLAVSLDLRKNVTFHNGAPLTSKDVEFSLRTYADPTNAGQLARVAQQIDSYDTSEPHRITLHLSAPTNNIFDLLSIVPITEKNSFGGWTSGEKYIGTGPFTFSKWYPGSRVEFTANKDYWAGAPPLDGAELLVVPNQQTEFSQLRSGQLDVVADPAPRDAEAVADKPAFHVIDTAGSASMVYLGVNTTTPGLNDARVRRAINLAVDRERIANEVYRGRARTASLPWPEYSPAFDDRVAHPERDLDQARNLIDGTDATAPLTISYTANSIIHQNIAQIISNDLAEVGIDCTLEPVEYTTMISRLRDGAFPGLWVLDHGFSQFQPSTLVTSAFPFNSTRNSSNYANEAYAADVRRAWRTPEPNSPEARSAYDSLNKRLLDESFVIELASPTPEIITTGSLHGVGWSKRGELDLSDSYFTR